MDSEGIGDQGTVTDFSSYFHVDNCSSLGFKPTMSDPPDGRKGTTGGPQNPQLKFDLTDRDPVTPTSNRSR